ncbi:MAG: Hsp20/alpha crystallin family protein [Candidatus Bathycorpusculaceae bacterium]
MTEVDEAEYALPEPERLFPASESILTEEREPLIDVFEENDAVKIYIEALAEIKNEMRLKVTEDQVEITARNFCKSIDLSTYNLEREKAYYHFKNSMLEITLPKKERTEVLAVPQVS